MLPITVVTYCIAPLIELPSGIVTAWERCLGQDDLRAWRSLAVWCFDLAKLLASEEYPHIAEDLDALGGLALQRSFDLHPAREEEHGLAA